MSVRTAEDLLAWLDDHEAGDRARKLLHSVERQTESILGLADGPGDEARLFMIEGLLLTMVVVQLGDQLGNGDVPDREGLHLVGHFFKTRPALLSHLQGHKPVDPERARLYNAILARAQAEMRVNA